MRNGWVLAIVLLALSLTFAIGARRDSTPRETPIAPGSDRAMPAVPAAPPSLSPSPSLSPAAALARLADARGTILPATGAYGFVRAAGDARVIERDDVSLPL